MAVAYAIAERLSDELDQCAADSDCAEEYEQTVDDLVDLTAFAVWVHAGYRLEFRNVTEIEVPKESEQ